MIEAWAMFCWLWAGWELATAVRPRVSVAQVPTERLTPVYQALDDDLARMVLRARLTGPGFVAFQNATIMVDGTRCEITMACTTGQHGIGAEVEKRR